MPAFQPAIRPIARGDFVKRLQPKRPEFVTPCNENCGRGWLTLMRDKPENSAVRSPIVHPRLNAYSTPTCLQLSGVGIHACISTSHSTHRARRFCKTAEANKARICHTL